MDIVCLIAFGFGVAGFSFGLSGYRRSKRLMPGLVLACTIIKRNRYGLSKEEYAILKKAVGRGVDDVKWEGDESPPDNDVHP